MNLSIYLNLIQFESAIIRSYLKTIVSTHGQADLKRYISEWYNKREVSIIRKQDLEVKALPEFVRIFGKSESKSRKLKPYWL